MKQTPHLNDTTIQEYVTDRQHCNPSVIAHMQTCTACQQKAAVYEQLITAIQQQPAPVLGFDIATLVMPQLPAPSVSVAAPVKKRPLMPVLLITMAVLSIPVFLLQRSANKPVIDDLVLPLCFLLPVALGILWAHIREAYSNYQKRLLAIQ